MSTIESHVGQSNFTTPHTNNAGPALIDAPAVDREHLRSIASSSIFATRRFARRFSLGIGLFMGVVALLPIDIWAAKDGLDILGLLFMNLFTFAMFCYPLRAVMMRDVHQLEKLVEYGVAHRGQLVARQNLPESPLGGPSNMRIEWEERGRRVWAIANDISDVIKGPVSREATVLTRGRKRWVGAVVGEKLLLARRPPPQYHLWGRHE